jgi:hypothetical protein
MQSAGFFQAAGHRMSTVIREAGAAQTAKQDLGDERLNFWKSAK